MPKKNNKKRGGAKAQEGVVLPSTRQRDEDGSVDDNCSTQSVLSDDSSWQSLDPVNGGEEDSEVLSEQENFENSFNDFLDAAMEKSATTRVNALKGIKKSLQQKYCPTFLDGRKETVMDCMVKCLRKGKGEELSLAASCLCLVTIQLGEEAESIFLATQPLLTTMLADNSTSYAARASCALSLAVSCMLCGDDPEIVKTLTSTLEGIFRFGYGKGENSPGVSPNDSWLICQALNSWCFMLAFAPSYQIQKHIEEHMSNIPDLLQSSDVDLRIAAGQTLALMYELARDNDEEFEFDDEETLCETLKQLSTDFMKHHAKKDRREQKSHFRDIYSYVLNDESPAETIRLGKMNQFELNGWAQKRQYEVLCQVLSTGTSAHLKANPLLRELFYLGPPGMDEYSYKRSLTKAQRTVINAASFKARSKARAKHRDKRSAATYGF